MPSAEPSTHGFMVYLRMFCSTGWIGSRSQCSASGSAGVCSLHACPLYSQPPDSTAFPLSSLSSNVTNASTARAPFARSSLISWFVDCTAAAASRTPAIDSSDQPALCDRASAPSSSSSCPLFFRES